jgi:hypothetical protein
LKIIPYKHKFDYTFGSMSCYDHYVIGLLHSGVIVNNEIAMRMLTDINDYYGKEKIVFISNREFGHDVDAKVYQLVNAKTMIGIAVVGTTLEQKIQAATEQSLYSGSFGFFNNMESAVAWAESFTDNEDERHAG